MKRTILLLIVACILLSGVPKASAVNIEPSASYATYHGSFEAKVTIPKQVLSYGTYESWVLSVRMNYSAQYNTNNGKISSVTYKSAQFYPNNTVSPDGHGHATSINYDSVNATISSDGYSITFIPYCSITLIYYQHPTIGANAVVCTTPTLVGKSVTQTPNTF